MMRQVIRLSSFIKPSSPNDITRTKIKENTDTWMTNNMHILRQHYQSVISGGLENLPPFNPIPFNKAIQWGRSRYGRKLTSSSINTLRETITNPAAEEVPSPPRLSPLEYPPLPEASNSPCLHHLGQRPPTPLTLCNTKLPSPIITLPITSLIPPPPSTPPSLSNTPLPRLNSPVPPISSLFPPLPLSPDGDLCTSPKGADNPTRTPPPTLRRNPERTVKVMVHPLSQRVVQRLTRRAIRPGAPPAPSPTTPPVHIDTSHPLTLPYNNVALPCSNTISFLSSETLQQQREPEQVVIGPADDQITTEAGVENNMMMAGTVGPTLTSIPPPETPATDSSSDLLTPSGPPPRTEPYKHGKTFQKAKFWSLEVSKKVVVIGDSNLARIPSFSDPDIQIDSYPGASFKNIFDILFKLTPHPETTQVILSVGIINCLSLNTTVTISKNLALLWRTAKAKFPNATIHIPIINFSPHLPPNTRSLLNHLNTILANKYNFIPEINPLLFQVTPDHIHWTPQTAEMIFQYWKTHLNC